MRDTTDSSESEFHSDEVDAIARLDEYLRSGGDPGLNDDETAQLDESRRAARKRLFRLLKLDSTLEEPAARASAHAGSAYVGSAHAGAADAGSANIAPPVDLPAGFGKYEIERLIGRGGFADVYKARDVGLKRTVALKLPKAELLVSERTQRRFLREAQAAASLDHPNIVAVFDAGIIEDRPYIVYAYCPGPTLAAWSRREGRPAACRVAAEILLEIATAVGVCHRRGIVHRDIKPSNVLLFPREATPSGLPFVAKLADLGLAAPIAASADVSKSAAIVGTPAYMAPEQAFGRAESVGPASDIYALGAVLYYLLTTRPPALGGSWAETLVDLQLNDPPPPRLLNRTVDVDLQTICLKCLERSPDSRYTSSEALCDDLRRYLIGERILARPATRCQRMMRWVRRRPAVAALIGSVCLLSVGFVAMLGYQLRAADRHGDELRQQNRALQELASDLNQAMADAKAQAALAMTRQQESRRLAYASDVRTAWQTLDGGDWRAALAFLDWENRPPEEKEFAGRHLRRRLKPTGRPLTHLGHTVWTMACSPDKRLLAVAGDRNTLYLLDMSVSSQVRREIATDHPEINAVDFSPDGLKVVTAGDDGAAVEWDVRTALPLRRLSGLHDGQLYGVKYLDEGRKLLACGQSTDLLIWDLTDAGGGAARRIETGHARTIEAMAISPDGSQVLTAGADGRLCRIDLHEPQSTVIASDSRTAFKIVAWSPDGHYAAAGTKHGQLEIYESESWQKVFAAQNADPLTALAFETDRITVADRGGVVRCYDLVAEALDGERHWRQTAVWAASDVGINSLVYELRGRRIITADRSGQVNSWRSGTPGPVLAFDPVEVLGHQAARLRWADQGNRIWVADDSHLRLYQSEAGEWNVAIDQPLDRELTDWTVVPNTHELLLLDSQSNVGLWPYNTQPSSPIQWQEADELSGVHKILACRRIELSARAPGQTAAEPSPTDQLLFAASTEQDKCVFFNWDTGVVFPQLSLNNVATCSISPDGRRLAIGEFGTNGLLTVDLIRPDVFTRRKSHVSTVRALAFAPDGTHVVSVSDDRTVVIWDLRRELPVHHLVAHEAEVMAAAISTDGRTLATGDNRGTIKLWLMANGRELYELPTLSQPIETLDFSQDGRTLRVTTTGGPAYCLASE